MAKKIVFSFSLLCLFAAIIEAAQQAKKQPGKKQEDPRIKSLFEYAIANKDAYLRRLNVEMKALKRKRISTVEKKRIAEELRETIEQIETGDSYALPDMPYPMQRGKVGGLPPIKIIQVINSGSALVEAEMSGGRDVVFMIRGLDFTGRAENVRVAPHGPFEVTGTVEYTTVAGAQRSVALVQPFDDSLLLQRIKSSLSRANHNRN